jgi:hypothetical protein
MLYIRFPILVLLLTGCALTQPQRPTPPTPPTTPVLASPTPPALSTPETRPDLPPTGTITPTPECQAHDGTMEIEISDAEIQVGEPLTITGRLSNQGCAMLGLPLYHLVQTPPEATLFEPAEVEPVLHSLGLTDGDQDQAQFILTARYPGKAQFSISASVEVHLGYPGPAYWATVSSPAVEVTVSP